MVQIRLLLADPLTPPESSTPPTLTLEDDSIDNNGKGQVNISELEEEVLRFQIYSVLEIPPDLISFSLPKKKVLQDGDEILIFLNYTSLNESLFQESSSSSSQLEGIPPIYMEASMQYQTAMADIFRRKQDPSKKSNEDIMIRRIFSYLQQTQQYEQSEYQEKARSFLPHDRLWNAVLQQNYTDTSETLLPTPPSTKWNYPASLTNSKDERTFLQELLNWFKHDFFTWTNAPPCQYCGNKETQPLSPSSPFHTPHIYQPLPEELQYGARRVEIYSCPSCYQITRFPRYNSSVRLLDPEIRRGRCGEWANVFTLLVRSLGFPARLIMDWTDHVWTEVWLQHEQRWCHMDSCEAALDTPLIYEAGWGKSLNYILGLSVEDGVTDVIWRYTRKWEEVLKRRNLVQEDFLDHVVRTMSISHRTSVEAYVRATLESKEIQGWKNDCGIENVREVRPEEHYGRQSGDVAWRHARGELGDGRVKEAVVDAAASNDIIGLNTATEETNERSVTLRNTNTASTPSQEEIAELTKLYFTQLTDGCPDGTTCPDPEYCGTCKENPNKAAITALKLAMAGDRSRLCLS